MILFLDLDGVLRRQSSPKYRLEPDLVDRFEATLRERPKVSIVISSTWSEAFSLDDIRSNFSLDTRLKIIGATPTIAGQHDDPRQREVEAWLKKNGGERWVAIDDKSDLYRPGAPVIAVNPNEGFSEASARELLKLSGVPSPHET